MLTRPDAYHDWTDARFVSAEPPGALRPGTLITLEALALGRAWPVRIDIVDLDPGRRWIDMVVHLPFAIDNHEHLTLAETEDGGTFVRFN